ncbi:hypothetical protein M885DRAFT_465842 [Pelagophyceae sp. CCMP2097]|nr:hypothetical protein M885DRAFT_465842 [Pelagophyceae sp. CCMP2097]|mmetsp:Transcript_1597/g.5758  ORF Transcript_1597/g.5758 Transcript_1597/m.5758 type:complete len:421 (-) Transcript_1597:34-1296(-)
MPRRLALCLAGLWLRLASTAWDDATNATCLGGCACRPRLVVAVPTAPSKDLAVLGRCLASVVEHVLEAEAVVVISRKSPDIDRAIATVNRDARPGRPVVTWFDEDSGHFPFDYSSVRSELEKRSSAKHAGAYEYAVGWYLQQLIKLYAGRAMHKARDGISKAWTEEDGLAEPPFDTMVLDSDVVFLRNVAYVRSAKLQNGRCEATYNYAFSRESHQQYYDTNSKLLNGDKPLPDSRGRDISGVVHHMVVRSDVVAEIERRVSAAHFGRPLWSALLGPEGIISNPQSNTFSEYQLYFHFARRHFPSSVHVRQLYWANGPGPSAVVLCAAADAWPADRQMQASARLDAIAVDTAAGYDYVAYHSYAKRRPCVYGPGGGGDDVGACFGGGCTHPCYKRRDETKFKTRDREATAPRLCRAALEQ